ncbi:olfactory receptor 10V1 [Tupaia chinensis]|uniref:olfactory receptor 10V1 n=1 Tax=Tupaia chinensis TaxID=246437 RepID=UPI000FFCA354|nr:olfactory receptor 10V1 [Tupaia chinensis]
MGDENQTAEIQFHFYPFSPILEVQIFIFVIFLLLYIGSLVGNATIFLTVWAEHSLHTPMYFFLANLAFLEIFYSSTVAPLALVNLLTMGRIPISFTGCGTQMFFFIFLGSADCILLGIMAYDRFVAIRDPLRYTLIMRWQLCAQLSAGALVLGFIQALQLTVLIFHLPFCGHSIITHFYCDVLPILRLACGDTQTPEAMLFIISVISLTIPFSLISISYIFIVAAILKIRSAEGRHKAFSTCSSHVTVVLLQYGCCSLIYLRPSSSYNPEMGRVVSVVYTFVTPFLNPLIYSMRNKELKDALNKVSVSWLLIQYHKSVYIFLHQYHSTCITNILYHLYNSWINLSIQKITTIKRSVMGEGAQMLSWYISTK